MDEQLLLDLVVWLDVYVFVQRHMPLHWMLRTRGLHIRMLFSSGKRRLMRMLFVWGA